MAFDGTTIKNKDTSFGKGIGAGVSAVGDIVQGMEESRAYKRNAALDIEEARLKASARIKAGDEQQAHQKVQFAKSGFVMTQSPMMILEETSRAAEADALMILRGGQLKEEQGRTAGVRSLFSGYSNAFSRVGEFTAGLKTTKKEPVDDKPKNTAPRPVFKPTTYGGM